MIPGAHVVLHLGLCNAMLNVPEGKPITAHVRLVDRLNRPHVDQDVSFERYGQESGEVNFNAPQGLYQIQVAAPQYRCYAVDWLFIIADHNRTIKEQMTDGAPVVPHPMLMDGTAPQSFLYLNPTYVLFPKGTPCDKPVPDALPAKITIENDQDSFYIGMYADPTLVAQGPVVVALQLETATGDDHYIRLKVPFPQPWDGLPMEVQFNVTDDEVDWLSGQPTGVLLCPRLFRTSAG
ncbi:MAG TPA: hypothetical protein VMB20_04520 [Candidatus Acidoferrum sp.]|nr:hypothetical protein [Candidatus Acidoferrum sp.]